MPTPAMPAQARTHSRAAVAAGVLAAVAVTPLAAAPAASALTPELTGALQASDPVVEIADSSYGMTVNTTWLFTNHSNQRVSSLGVAYLDGTMTMVTDHEGEPMRVNCIDGAFPLRPNESVHCTLWRIVTDEEKAAGRTRVVPVDFRPGYGPGWPDLEYYRMDAPDGPSIALPGATPPPAPEPNPAPAGPDLGSLAGGSLAGVAPALGPVLAPAVAALGSLGR